MTILNKANIAFAAVMPDGQKFGDGAESNSVSTEILSHSVDKKIGCEKEYVRQGENVRHTVTITNNSSAKLFDNYFTIPQSDGASYVAGSVKVNGIAQPDYDPVKGFALPDLAPAESVVIEYDLKVTADETAPVTHFATLKYTVNDPARGNVAYAENTDTTAVRVIADKISVIKSVDKTFAVVGEKLHYTVTIVNIGNVIKSDMTFRDPIPDGTTFVPDSIKINGVGYPVYNPEIGFVLRSLAPGEATTVEFDVTVN